MQQHSSASLPSEPLPWRPNTRPELHPMKIVTDIDQGPLWYIFTEWLRIEDVCHLDSALCQKSLRPGFLQLVATKVLRFGRAMPCITRITTIAEMNWIRIRDIHVASLRVPPHSADMNSAEREKRDWVQRGLFCLER